MGIYLNPGFDAFQIARDSEIFVDKSEMILFINSVVKTNQRYISVSRPRRFGKSMAADMLCAYYGKEKATELFGRCKLSSHKGWDRYLGQFDVIRLVMTDFFKDEVSVQNAIRKMSSRILDELDEAYPGVNYDPDDLSFSMDKFYRKSGKAFAVIIDEWDAVFRESKEDKDGQKNYLEFLRDWLKDKTYVALAYMTGILPIKKYGKHSALNMFGEYSMTSPLQMAPYTGFTEEDVRA